LSSQSDGARNSKQWARIVGEYTYDFVPTSVAPQHVFSVIFVRLLFADVERTTENNFMLSSIGLQFITIQLTLNEFEHLLCWSSNLLLRALGDGSSRFERCSH